MKEKLTMVALKSLLFAVFTYLSGSYYHPVHVSVLNMEYQAEKSTLELSFKVFTADLEFAIAHNYNVALNLGQNNESKEADLQIKKYLSATFRMLINNKESLQIAGIQKETIEDATWIKAVIPVSAPFQSITVHNALLMDLYQDQTNLLILTMDKKESGYRLDFYNREITVKSESTVKTK